MERMETAKVSRTCKRRLILSSIVQIGRGAQTVGIFGSPKHHAPHVA